jgi:hypothetical protein
MPHRSRDTCSRRCRARTPVDAAPPPCRCDTCRRYSADSSPRHRASSRRSRTRRRHTDSRARPENTLDRVSRTFDSLCCTSAGICSCRTSRPVCTRSRQCPLDICQQHHTIYVVQSMMMMMMSVCVLFNTTIINNNDDNVLDKSCLANIRRCCRDLRCAWRSDRRRACDDATPESNPRRLYTRTRICPRIVRPAYISLQSCTIFVFAFRCEKQST